MKKGYSRDYTGSKLYFTEGDASSQKYYSIGLKELDVKLKLWLLLNDHVILSAGHMLESPITFEWLTSSPDISALANDLAILPSLREDRKNFESFVSESPEKEDRPSMLQSQRNLFLGRARELDSIFKSCIAWSPQAESEWFRDSLVRDLRDSDSPIRRRLIGVSNNDITNLAEEIADCEFLTREWLEVIVTKHCSQRHKMICKYGDLFYYLSGALFKGAEPLLHPQAATLCQEKVSYEISNAQEYKPVDEYWRTILDLWQVSKLAISRLTLRDIISIRKDGIGKRVRKTWKRITDEAKGGVSRADSVEEFLNSRSELLELLRQEMTRQQERYTFFEKTRGRVEIASWATTGIGPIAGLFVSPTFALSALGIVGLFVNKPLFDAIEKQIPGTELVLLSSRIK